MIQVRPAGGNDNLFNEPAYRSTGEYELKLTNRAEAQKNAFIMVQSMAQPAEYKIKFSAWLLFKYKMDNRPGFVITELGY